MRIRLGIAFSFGVSIEGLVALVRLADECGYDGAYVADAQFDHYAALAACAVQTEQIRLVTSVTGIYRRTPTSIAISAATVDSLSRGRFVLGLGVGHAASYAAKDDVEIARPMQFTRGIRALRETTDIARGVWLAAHEEREFSYQGELYRVAGFAPRMRPFRTTLPIHFGTLGPQGVSLGLDMADGLIASLSTLSWASDLADRAGVKQVSCYVPTCVSDSRADARRAVRRRVVTFVVRHYDYQAHLQRIGHGEAVDSILRAHAAGGSSAAEKAVPDDLLRAATAYGTPDDCAAALLKFSSAGLVPVVSSTHPEFRDLQQSQDAYDGFHRNILQISEALQ